jgi:fatty-acyl-CoA synthase
VARHLGVPPETLVDALERAALDHRDRGIGIFDSRAKGVDRRTYAELAELGRDRARRLAGLGIAKGEPVVVALPTSWQWLEAWFGVVLAGGLPVASSGTGAMAAADAQLNKVDAVMERIGARYVIADQGFKSQASAQAMAWTARVIVAEELDTLDPAPELPRPAADPDSTAFLQLTSGSTGTPRAVMISHRAAIHNPLASCDAIGAPHGAPVHEWADAMVSWLPLYHDMGLIGCLILPILTGLDVWLLRPQTFLARPRIWLEQLASHGTTFVPAPNFGYQLCVERVEPSELEGDLRGWKAALTGAEMIREETTSAFSARFASLGFDPSVFRPCYGLAEATLAVTFDQRGQGVRTLPFPGADLGFGLSEVVSTGTPIADTAVEIVPPAGGSPLGEDTIGEVRIKGPGVFLGYYNDPEATADALKDGWLMTGDLGFLHRGELYLTGRTKEVLIIHGHNLMPDEIERIADGVTGGGGLMRSAAFSVARGREGEQAVLVVEVADREPTRLASIEQEIRVKVARTLALPIADLRFVRRGRIPRTSSGKMQRHELRRMYLEGTLESIDCAEEGARWT